MKVTAAPILPGCTVLPPMDELPATTIEPQKPTKRKGADRFAVLNSFIDFTIGGLSRAEAVTWLILYRDVRDGRARTSQADIARRGGVSVRQVGRAIRQLSAKSLLTVARQGGLRQGPSVYRIHPLSRGHR